MYIHVRSSIGTIYECWYCIYTINCNVNIYILVAYLIIYIVNCNRNSVNMCVRDVLYFYMN